MHAFKLNKLHKLIFSSLIFVVYLTIMYYTKDYASSRYQVRVATSLYALSYFFPFLIFPLALSNMFSNFLIAQLGLWDMVGGFAVGLLTAYIISLCGKKRLNYLLVAPPIVLIPALFVPLWLSYIKGFPYITLLITIGIGQMVPATIGMLLTGCIDSVNSKLKINTNCS